MNGIFITFEGPDGAGKTTQLKKLAEELKKQGHDVLVTREPGGTAISDQIRSIILDPVNKEMVDQAEVLLYASSRAQHVHQLILPALAAGRIVLCDRFIDASVAYQAYGLGVDVDMVKAISRYASSGLQATRTYILDVPVEVSLARLHHRASGTGVNAQQLDRIEQKNVDYHSRVREGFHQIAADHPERVRVVNANRSEDEIAKDIRTDCNQLLEEHISC
ncbi:MULTISPECIES: dTMP kinase [unclassified Paenibacillus]|uniref:dTMP kinase n=1 Tax=unclassified Paenibacillus TaxID=185978 RepID=UPI00070D7153|nr:MULTISPECIES: dTMP kinase [unclassified Paenibacillus]KQX57712.1 thymidylate kinase [Paenibacillus sp. Root444D2]KRE45406.1 thymidylate kinase [Paenibacillus sp. Soil724D2]